MPLGGHPNHIQTQQDGNHLGTRCLDVPLATQGLSFKIMEFLLDWDYRLGWLYQYPANQQFKFKSKAIMEKEMLLSSFLSNLSCLSLQLRVWNHFLSSLLYAATRNKVEAMRLQPCLELLVVWHFVIPQGISRTHRMMQQSYRLVNTSEINHANTH